MKPEKKHNEKEPQLELGLTVPGNQFAARVKHRTRYVVLLLEQFSYWRSALLWFLILTNVVCSYALFSILKTVEGVPPTIPLLYYADSTSGILVETHVIPYFTAIYLGIQCFIIFLCFRLHFKVRALSQFLLIISILLTVLFFAGLYKSITLTLPS